MIGYLIIYRRIFFNQFVNKFSDLLLCTIDLFIPHVQHLTFTSSHLTLLKLQHRIVMQNIFDILNMVDFSSFFYIAKY